MKNLVHRPLLHLGLAFVLSALALAEPVLLSPDARPEGDAPRYIAMGLNLLEHGVISGSFTGVDQAPKPGLGSGGPLIAVELAVAAWLDPGTRETFLCTLSGSIEKESCPVQLMGLKVVHWIEIALFGAALWWSVWLFGRRLLLPWIAVGLALLCRELTANAQQALTESLLLAILGLFMIAWIRAWQGWRWADWGLVGLSLGLLILTKPAFAALGVMSVGLLGIGVIFRWCDWRGSTVSFLALGAGCCLVLAPWLVRNLVLLGSLQISDPGYFDTAFAHRVAYNAMSWREWLVGWIYYLPDFGDSLAARLFPSHLYQRLGWGDLGYYIYGRDVLHNEAVRAAAPQSTGAYLIDHYAVADPIKHAMVSLLLAWRGLFVGKIWGLVGLAALLPAVLRLSGIQRRLFVLLLLPGIAMLFAQSLVSVSIPRYNLTLIPVFALAAATLVIWGVDAVRSRWRYRR